MQPLRILLVDDHVLFRKGLAALLGGRAEIRVVGEGSDGLEALELARALHPDVVLMDIHMPHRSGLEATRDITAELPAVRVIILSVSDDEKDLFDAIKSGAIGYILKNIDPGQLFAMLEGVQRGEAPITGVLAARILDEFRRQNTGARRDGAEPPDELSARELEVLRLVARGETNREVAAHLSVTENTVKIHLRNILDKLHLQNRTQAAAYALRKGLVDDSEPEE